MPAPALLVDADTVARRIGVPLPLTADQRATIEDAIRDGQEDVEGYLLRPLAPVEVTRTGLTPQIGHDVLSWKAWGSDLFDDDFTVVSATEATDGNGWTVVFLVGLQDPSALVAMQRYVRAHAGESVRLSASSGMGKRQVTSMSADGQSVSLEQAKTTYGAPGGLPTLDTLKRWQRNGAVYQSDRQHSGPWPMVSAPVGWDPT